MSLGICGFKKYKFNRYKRAGEKEVDLKFKDRLNPKEPWKWPSTFISVVHGL